MAGDWRYLKLGDVVELKRGYDLPSRDRIDGPYPIISSAGISGSHSHFKAKAPGVVIGRYGTLGEVHYITQDYWPLNTSLYVRNFRGNDPRFVGYFLRCLDFKAYSDKAAVPGLNRNDLHTAPVLLPPVEEQRTIAHILGTLDDKIELNRRMSETLEAMARALFTSWFVDFDPVRAKANGRDTGLPKEIADLFPDSFEDSELGEIPKRWGVATLDTVAGFRNGLALQKYPQNGERSLPAIKIAQLRAGHAEVADRVSADIPADYIVEDGDVIFSWSGSLECKIWTGGKGALNQHLFKVTSERYPQWLYYFAVHRHLPEFRRIAAGKATTMGHIQRHHLTDARIAVPDVATLRGFDGALQSLLGASTERLLQSKVLRSLRDALLPELMRNGVPPSTI
jgi:type I restriction enzyme S subunit